MTYLKRERINNIMRARQIIERLEDFKKLQSDTMSEEALSLNACMQHNLYRELVNLIGEVKAKAIYKKIYGEAPDNAN